MSFDASQQPHWSWLEGGKWKAASNLDLTASRQLGIQPGREVHLQKYLLFVQVHESKVKVRTSSQVHMW